MQNIFKVDNKNTRTTSIKCSGVFIVNFKHILSYFEKTTLGARSVLKNFTKLLENN